MTIQETISQTMIHFFIHPFHRHKPTDFQSAFENVKRALIVCPAVKGVPASSELFLRFADLFAKAETQLVFPEDTKGDLLDGLLDRVLFLDISKPTLWNCLRSQTLKTLLDKNWDAILDLDVQYSTLTAYLCRRIQPGICIGFQKPYSHRLFNLEYKNKSTDQYAKRLDGLFAFLKQLVEKDT